jgi:glycosyltransferase involved in cell wall biosynthesis
LFGEEPWERELRARVERLGLRERVHFLGFRSDVPALLASIDGAIHASTVAEPFGLVILEAQLAGVPVVATAAGGALEIVEPGKTGWLVPPGDPSALASVLREWSERPEESRALGRAASEHAAATFDARRLRRRFLEILEREAAR